MKLKKRIWGERFCLKFGKNMSKIGKKPVDIKEGVTVSMEAAGIKVNGPKGTLTFKIPQGISVKISDERIEFSEKNQEADNSRALFGLTRSIVSNMIAGVSLGFEKRLELSGVGYRAQVSGEDLILFLGFSHPVKISPDEGIKFQVADNAIIISGIDKALVGNTAAKIRAIRPPEPYKGKGIKYQGEIIRRKAGKAAKAVGGLK